MTLLTGMFFKLYRNKVTKMIRVAKENYFKDVVYKCNGNSGKYGRHSEMFLPQKTRVNPTSMQIDGKTLETENDICNGF